MNSSISTPKFELIFVVFILFCFVYSVNLEEKKQTYSSAFYVDMRATGGNDGTSLDNAWPSLNHVDWDDLSTDDVLLVITGNGTNYTLNSPLSPTLEQISIVGIDLYNCANYSTWGVNVSPITLYGTKTKITIGSNPVFDLTSSTGIITIENIILDNSSVGASNTIDIDSCNEVTIIDCDIIADDCYAVNIYQSDDVYIRNCNIVSTSTNAAGSYAVYLEGGSEVTFDECTISTNQTIAFYAESSCTYLIECNVSCAGTGVYPLIYLEDVVGCEIEECTTSIDSGGTCGTLIELYNAENTIVCRNKFHTGSAYQCQRGIHVRYHSINCSFVNNSVYGEFVDSAVKDDYDNYGGLSWDNNTINNTGAGNGYWGARYYDYPVTSFRNNIILNDSSSNFAIKIDSPQTYWQPTVSCSMNYNCYCNYGAGVFGYWGTMGATNYMSNPGGGVTTYWQNSTWTNDEANSVHADPNLAANGYNLTSSSNAVMYAGYQFSASDVDIEGYLVPENSSGKVSMGCDQATVLDYIGTYYYWTTSSICFPDATITPGYWPSFTIEFTCYGGASLHVTNLSITGPDAAAFYFTSPTNFYVNHGVSNGVLIGVNVSSQGIYNNADFEITYDGTVSSQGDSIGLEVEVFP